MTQTQKTATQLEHEIREFLTSGKRSFMRPEVTDKQSWAYVETNAGGDWVPASVLTASELAAAKRGDFSPMLKYTEGTRLISSSSKMTTGYGVRLTAPGYMDATEWEVYPSKREALARALELARDYEGEDE